VSLEQQVRARGFRATRLKGKSNNGFDRLHLAKNESRHRVGESAVRPSAGGRRVKRTAAAFDVPRFSDCLVKRHATATGRELSGSAWYQAFSAWKLAIVLEASHVKHFRRESTNSLHAFRGFVVDQLLDRARRFAR
jgi:hypothetical protein